MQYIYIYIYNNPKKTKLRGSKKLVCRLATLQKKTGYTWQYNTRRNKKYKSKAFSCLIEQQPIFDTPAEIQVLHQE